MIHAYHAASKGAPLTPFEYKPAPLGPYDLFLSISHCGICHSDLHLINNDWGVSTYPLVPGHEIVGHIKEKGSLVDQLEIGQRVGIGWQGKSCMHCEWCLQGDENLCLSQEATCIGHHGGFATGIVADSRFAFPLPDSLPSSHAAPLLCGGATVFAPFLEHKIAPTMKVAIIGIGGLGHLALQFARAIGCEVTAISHSSGKEKEAKGFGAHHVLSTKELEAAKNSFDFILSTASSGHSWAPLIAALRPRGKLCLLGGLETNLDVGIGQLVDGRKVICGSNIGSRPVIKRMLQFATLHGIAPQIEEFPIKNVNDALEKMRKGTLRYRAVLTINPQ